MANYEPLQDRAYAYLKKRIINGGLTPGVIYSETKLAAEIGISRTPMKDALVRLSQDKYIDIIPSKGFLLHVMTTQDIWTTYQARTAVEGFCALALTKGKNTPRGQETLARMAQSMERMREGIAEGICVSDLLPCDLLFHQVLTEFPRNEELSRLFETLNHRVSLIALDSFAQPGRPQAALEEHRAIYQAILDADDTLDIAPYEAVMRHMENSRDICLEHQSGCEQEGHAPIGL